MVAYLNELFFHFLFWKLCSIPHLRASEVPSDKLNPVKQVVSVGEGPLGPGGKHNKTYLMQTSGSSRKTRRGQAHSF